MASKWKLAEVKSHVGGLNIYANPTQVKEDESPDSVNIEYSGITAVKKRRGYNKLTSVEIASGSKVRGLFSYITNSGSEVLYVSNGVLYKYNSGVSSAITGGTFNTTKNVSGCQVGDRLYLFDGNSSLQYYNGTNLTTADIVAAPTKVKAGIYFNRRIYCNSDDQKDRIYYGKALTATGTSTDTGDFTSGDAAGYYGFGLGKEVVGFAKTQTSLYVFLKDSIYKIDTALDSTSGVLSHAATQISNSIGCRSARSIENVENDVFFLDSTLYSLGELANYATIRTTNISSKIKPVFDSMDQSDLENASAIYYDKEALFLLAIQTGGTNNDTVVGYSVAYKAWFKWTGLQVNSWTEYVDSTNTKHLYFSSDSDSASYVYEMFQGQSDNGAAIDSYYKTKEFDLEGFHFEKIFKKWDIEFGNISGSVTIDVYVDSALADSVTFSGSNTATSDAFGTQPLGTFPFGVEGWYTEVSTTTAILSNQWRWHTLTSSPRGSRVQLVYRNATLNESFEVKQARLEYIGLPLFKKNTLNKV